MKAWRVSNAISRRTPGVRILNGETRISRSSAGFQKPRQNMAGFHRRFRFTRQKYICAAANDELHRRGPRQKISSRCKPCIARISSASVFEMSA